MLVKDPDDVDGIDVFAPEILAFENPLPVLTASALVDVRFSLDSGTAPDCSLAVWSIAGVAMLESCPGSNPTNMAPITTAKIAYTPILIAVNLFTFPDSLNARLPNTRSNVRTAQLGFSLQIFTVSYQKIAAGTIPITSVVMYSLVGM